MIKECDYGKSTFLSLGKRFAEAMNDKSWASDVLEAKNRRLEFIIHFIVPFLYWPSQVTISRTYTTC